MSEPVTPDQVLQAHFKGAERLPRCDDNKIMIALTNEEYLAIREALTKRNNGPCSNHRALLGVMCGWFEILADKAGWTVDTAPAAWTGYRAAKEAMIESPSYADVDKQHVLNESLRDTLREVTAVAITMLYDSHKEDTLAEFSIQELELVVDFTRHLQTVPVESVYRRGFDASVNSSNALGGRHNGD